MFIDELNNLKNTARFTMADIIPALEKKISEIKKEDYIVDFFITNGNNSSLLDVRYLAFPKKDSYVKALFGYNGIIYKYSKLNGNNENLERLDASGLDISDINFQDLLEIQENDKVFLIAKEIIPIKESLAYLTMPHKEKYYLHEDFFCYDEHLDEIGDVITDVANKKIPKM